MGERSRQRANGVKTPKTCRHVGHANTTCVPRPPPSPALPIPRLREWLWLLPPPHPPSSPTHRHPHSPTSHTAHTKHTTHATHATHTTHTAPFLPPFHTTQASKTTSTPTCTTKRRQCLNLLWCPSQVSLATWLDQQQRRFFCRQHVEGQREEQEVMAVNSWGVEVLSHGVPLAGIGGVGFSTSLNLATDHTFCELCFLHLSVVWTWK